MASLAMSGLKSHIYQLGLQHTQGPGATNTYTTTAASFFSLPSEIRTQILLLLLPHKQNFYIDNTSHIRASPLLRVCQALRQDCLALIFGTNCFLVDLTSQQTYHAAASILSSLEFEAIRSLRSLILCLPRRSASCCKSTGAFYLRIRIWPSQPERSPGLTWTLWSACESCAGYQRLVRDFAGDILRTGSKSLVAHGASGVAKDGGVGGLCDDDQTNRDEAKRCILTRDVAVELLRALREVPTPDDYCTARSKILQVG